MSSSEPSEARLPELSRRDLAIRVGGCALAFAGAGLLLGSDSPQVFNVPGFATHRELDALVAAGLTPYEALRTGTVAVAEFLHANTGIVAVGREADLVLLDANPLADISNSLFWYVGLTVVNHLLIYLEGYPNSILKNGS